jgi:hypothetical protein
MPEDNLELALHMGGRERFPRPSDSLMGAGEERVYKTGTRLVVSFERGKK